MTGKVIDTKLYEFDLMVDFHHAEAEPTFTLEQLGKPKDGPIVVDSYLALLVFHLKPINVPDASKRVVFATTPQWLDLEGEPVPPPAAVAVARITDDNLTLSDINTASQPISGQPPMDVQIMSFLFSIVYNRKMYSSKDPIIINKEPPPQ